MTTQLLTAILFFGLVSCNTTTDNYPDLGDGYKLYGEGGYTTELVDSNNTVKVSEYILCYEFDSTFIIIMQSPPDSLPKINPIVFTDNDKKKLIADKNIFRQYWIICKKEDGNYSYDSTNQKAKYSNIYGPFNKTEYLKQREILKLSRHLRFKNE